LVASDYTLCSQLGLGCSS
jgi:hypothetical protein